MEKTPVNKYSKIRLKDSLKKILLFVKKYDDITDELLAFFKIIDVGMIDLTVSNANLNIESRRSNENGKDYYKFVGKDTTGEEIIVVILILYLIDVKKASKINSHELWAKDETDIKLLRGDMSINKFNFLRNVFRFDDRNTRNLREKDKLVPIKDLFG